MNTNAQINSCYSDHIYSATNFGFIFESSYLPEAEEELIELNVILAVKTGSHTHQFLSECNGYIV